MQSRWLRVTRGLAAGTVATLVAAASHTVAGGRMPGFAGLALALCFSAMVAVALGGRRLALVRLTASVVVGQVAFHVVFSTLGGAGQVVPGAHHSPASILPGADAVSHSVTHAGAGMWLAHAVAAALTVLAVRYAEVALATLRATGRMIVLPLLLRARPVVLPVHRAPLPAVETRLVPRIVRELHAAAGTRGPPPLVNGA